MLTKQTGDTAPGIVIAYFLSSEYEVCLPIGDKRDYYLVIEKSGQLARVQVKFAGWYSDKQKCLASLRVMGSNQSYHSVKKYEDDAFDLLFVYSAKGDKLSHTLERLSYPQCTQYRSNKYNKYKLSMQG